MDDLPVVQVWREINGVTDDGDFAFFFSSFEEAKQEVGDLIATAWQRARQQADGGVDKVVQAMLAREEKPIPPAPQVRQPAPSTRVPVQHRVLRGRWRNHHLQRSRSASRCTRLR